jgi:nitrate reductase gamma subunit
MTTVTIVFALMFYVAVAVLVAGLVYRVKQYALTPAPLKIPVMPAPLTRTGSAARVFQEVVFFKSLFKASKWTWIFGWAFHAALVVVLLRHLRYFTEPVWGLIVLVQPFGIYAGFAMVAGLACLWARRFLVDRMRYISSPSDHLFLILLLAIGVSGLLMKYVSHTDIVAFKAFTLGLVLFDWQPLPSDPLVLIHLTLVAVLMIVFPFSKMLHAPGLFFNPTRYQVDNARERRHVARRRTA